MSLKTRWRIFLPSFSYLLGIGNFSSEKFSQCISSIFFFDADKMVFELGSNILERVVNEIA